MFFAYGNECSLYCRYTYHIGITCYICVCYNPPKWVDNALTRLLHKTFLHLAWKCFGQGRVDECINTSNITLSTTCSCYLQTRTIETDRTKDRREYETSVVFTAVHGSGRSRQCSSAICIPEFAAISAEAAAVSPVRHCTPAGHSCIWGCRTGFLRSAAIYPTTASANSTSSIAICCRQTGEYFIHL